MAKKVATIIKLQLPSGKATMAPPVGPAFGQAGANGMEFVKAFNARTGSMEATIIPVVVTVFTDKTFTFILKTPPASILIKQAANLPKGSSNPLKEKKGTLTQAQVKEIAQKKLPDLNCDSLESACRIIEGTARSMGVTVVN